MTCRALWEPNVRRSEDTHSCCRTDGHEGPHLCPLCRATWTLPSPHPVVSAPSDRAIKAEANS
jgi:hypothetical protein